MFCFDGKMLIFGSWCFRHERRKHEDFVPMEIDQAEEESEKEDCVLNYHRAKLIFGLILSDFNDAVKEGDGERLMRLYKIVLPIYKVNGCTKYSYTVLLLLVKITALLPESLAFRLVWNRFFNITGKRGHNISLDHRMDMFIKLLKTFLKGLGANLTEESAQRVARCLNTLEAIMDSLDKECHLLHKEKNRAGKGQEEAVSQIIDDLINTSAFVKVPGREGYPNFPKFSGNLIEKLDYRDFYSWIKDKLSAWSKIYES